MRTGSPIDNPQASIFDIASQLERNHPLLALGIEINWTSLENSFEFLYSERGRAAKPIRLMVELLILKQFYNLSDESAAKWPSRMPIIYGNDSRHMSRLSCYSPKMPMSLSPTIVPRETCVCPR